MTGVGPADAASASEPTATPASEPTNASNSGPNASAPRRSSSVHARGPRVVTLGETMALMHSTAVGSLAHLPSVDLGIGGAESNVAIGLARLGVPAAWVGRVGADELGRRVLREIRGEEVDVVGVVDEERPTGLMIKSHPLAGATTVRYYRSGSAGSALGPEDVPPGLIERAEMLHLTGITVLLSDAARAAVDAAITRATAAGVTVSFDVNHRSALAADPAAAPLYAEIAARADIVFGGPEELALVRAGASANAGATEAAGAAGGGSSAEGAGPRVSAAGTRSTSAGGGAAAEDAGGAGVAAHRDPDARLAHALAELGISEVVEKRGAEGARALADGVLSEAAAHRVDVVDTVGAGDAFVAGYLSARLEGLDVPACLARANACGALTCMSRGDWEGAPRPGDLDALTAQARDPVSR